MCSFGSRRCGVSDFRSTSSTAVTRLCSAVMFSKQLGSLIGRIFPRRASPPSLGNSTSQGMAPQNPGNNRGKQGTVQATP
jgi:hypothetical protein